MRSYGPIFNYFTRKPRLFRRFVRDMAAVMRGFEYSQQWTAAPVTATPHAEETNPLREFFDAHIEGPGIVKWTYYFDAYHRHFQKFRGQEVHVLEIGVFSGGSLAMWKDYFGPQCRIYGVDIEESCKEYEDDQTKIFIGDQADRGFWKRLKSEVPRIDIVIDDGGHQPEQRIVTLEEMLPHIAPGGVFFCEDVSGMHNDFLSYMNGLAVTLNDSQDNPTAIPGQNTIYANPFQRDIASVHYYPQIAVIEKTPAPVTDFAAPSRGTKWQSFNISRELTTGA